MGLIPKSRLYVHLSDNTDTALSVGKRHGKPVILQVDAARMYQDGFKFYLSKNGVWLVDHVPTSYFTISW